MSAVDDRRQRALEAYWDQLGTRSAEVAAQEAIETATRVKITPEATKKAIGPVPRGFAVTPELMAMFREALIAALTELGFEVEE